MLLNHYKSTRPPRLTNFKASCRTAQSRPRWLQWQRYPNTSLQIWCETTTLAQVWFRTIPRSLLISILQVSGKPYPSPRLVYRMTLPSTLETIVGGYFVMSSPNKAIVQRSWGLLEYEALATKSASAKKERYGSSMVYDEFLRQKSTFSSALLTLTVLVVFSVLKFLPPVCTFCGPSWTAN